LDMQSLSLMMKNELKQFIKIKKAWVFGSFSRGEDNQMSDVDIALETDPGFSYFDLAEVQYKLEKNIKRKVDVGFLDAFKPHILDHIRPDLKLLYERQ
jgi:predicted nucleotidyltransferase